MKRRWDLWLAAAGFLMAVGDFAFFAYLDIDMTVAGRDVTAGLFVWFAVSFAAFGFVIGRLIDARARARAAARTIEAQMRALEDSQRALIQSEKLAAIGRLASGVAHEVRNPLGVIRASASMVQESFDREDEAFRACQFIKEEIDRLNGLITSLLNFARPTELRLQSVALEKVIDRALQLSSEAIEKRSVHVERETHGVVPPVQGDPDLLAQILVNLVSNAVDAVSEGGRVAIVATGRNGEAAVEVRDSGPGVAAEVATRLFEPVLHHEGHRYGARPSHGRAHRRRPRWAARPGSARGTGRLLPRDASPRGSVVRAPRRGPVSQARIAVLDDERRMVEILEMVLRREHYDVETFTDPKQALAALESRPFDLLITDLRMPEPDGLEVLRRARAADPELPVILMTAHATIPTAIAAMREGAFDYVEKPFDNDELRTLVRRAVDVTRLSRENRYLRAELASRYALDAVVAESPALREALDLVRRAARSPSTVLITGESGTGKELIARAVHYHSKRVGRPFVAANCKAFAAGVLESELFGHEKGAFTGADRAKAGLFEAANGGTLFLDEIGEVSLDFQGKLLRALQERKIQRVGSTDERPVDVRIVAATNRDLEADIRDGRFREDLYFRLAVIPIHLPPLRERKEDLLPLARHFLAKWNRELEREIAGWSDEVEAYFLRHAWPGNVRELENTIERGVVLARGERIELDDLLVETSAGGEGDSGPREIGSAGSLQDFLDESAAEKIRSVLEEVGGKRVEAARRLGVERTTLYRLMRKYGIQ